MAAISYSSPPRPSPSPDARALLRAHLVTIRDEANRALAELDAEQAAAAGPAQMASVAALYATAEQYAESMEVTRETVYTWIRLGMPHRRIGRYVRVDLAGAEAWHQGGGVHAAMARQGRTSARRGR